MVVVKDIRALLDIIIDRDGSDLHIEAGEPPVLRLHGHLVRLHEIGELTPEDTEHLMRTIASPRSQQELEERGGADFGFTYPGRARFRVSVFQQRNTIAINMRLIPFRLLSFEQLGLSASVQRLLHAPRGLILITGPTGSGKTTTLATMIDYINTNRDAHIITIEDPIEYFHTPKQSIITQREVHVDVPSFEEGVIKALRQDPDVILVGEMRDLNTISAAITAAETGHLVLSTLHTTGAARTVDRITDVFPMEQQEQIRVQLSGNLTAVISQLLLPRKEGVGRIPAYEIMVCTPAIQHMIRDHKTHSIFSAIQTGSQLGMIALDDHLVQLYKRGAIGKDEMIRVAQKQDEIYEKIGEAAPASVLSGAQVHRDGQPAVAAKR
ncbi:MAG TPA: type IV pilus twitching motility protein PilT [Armatimonadota bacterium]|jgi:twitching motility protein PilT